MNKKHKRGKNTKEEGKIKNEKEKEVNDSNKKRRKKKRTE